MKKSIALLNLSICYTCKNIKKSYNNYKFKISALTWNDFELRDGSYLISGIQLILSIFKKTWENTDNPSVRININKIKNRITFKSKTGYYLEFLTPETLKIK